MSMIEDVYRAHYSAVRQRLLGKISKSVVTDKPEVEVKALVAKPYWQVLQERKKARDLEAKRLLDEAIIKYASQGATPAQLLIRRVAIKHGLTYQDIIGRSRTVKIVAARFEAIALVHETYPKKSLPELGRLFHRDHTTMLHALRKMGYSTSKQSRMDQQADSAHE